MASELIIALISGFFGLLGTGLSIWATVTAQDVRREMQVKLVEPQLAAYRTLWALMGPASPSLDNDFTIEERTRMEEDFRRWYYENGNGIFLSSASRDLLVEAKEQLKSGGSSGNVRRLLSRLRSQLKNDIGVYGKEDVTATKRI